MSMTPNRILGNIDPCSERPLLARKETLMFYMAAEDDTT